MPSQLPNIVILTPISAEWGTVCDNLSEASLIADPLYPMKAGWIGPHRVVCVQSGKGEGRAAQAVDFVSRKWSPTIIVLSGIAGGFRNRGGREPGRGPKRGDVIVANFIYYLDFGKLANRSYSHRPDHNSPPDYGLRVAAETFADANPDWRRSIKPKRPDGLQLSGTHVCFGYVGSGNTLVDDATHEIFRCRRDGISLLDAVEMEACGAATAVESERTRRHVRFLMVRGISDEPRESGSERGGDSGDAGSQARDEWKVYAAAASATFVTRFLASLEPGAVSEIVPTNKWPFATIKTAGGRLFRDRTAVPRGITKTILSEIIQEQSVLLEGRKGVGEIISGDRGCSNLHGSEAGAKHYSILPQCQPASQRWCMYSGSTGLGAIECGQPSGHR